MAEIKERETAVLERAEITSNPQTAYRPPNENKLVGSSWRVISLVHETEEIPEFKSMVLTFQTDTKATKLVLRAADSRDYPVDNRGVRIQRPLNSAGIAETAEKLVMVRMSRTRTTLSMGSKWAKPKWKLSV